MCGLGWKSLGVLELTALPSIKKEYWMPAVQEADALLVWGGSPLYLCYWMRQSGLADLLPSLRPETVYLGTSGGAMVATPDFGGTTYDDSEPLTGSDERWGWLIFPCFRTWSARTCRTLPWPTSKSGPPGYQYRRTRSTTRPPSRWSTALSKSSPRGTGSCSPPGPRVPFTLRNIKKDLEDIGPRFDGAPDLEFRAATKALELEKSALSYQRVPPGYRFPYGHTHMKQEEVYVVLRGSGRMKVDDEIVELEEWDAVRVPPGMWRGYEAGPEGLEILVIGAPNLGEDPREDVDGRRDWWAG